MSPNTHGITTVSSVIGSVGVYVKLGVRKTSRRKY